MRFKNVPENIKLLLIFLVAVVLPLNFFLKLLTYWRVPRLIRYILGIIFIFLLSELVARWLYG
ncbi:hypothetical protein GI11188 [Calderihabitans maritimus]|uniref:Uncharacterized protein n=1 Tax=Calderihabitans maritimus TaxID=1246530 RepID=A0A1Z5HNE1_9FIRM|nr:hypothetical protein GI11188 [Calderihabitans maritimus]